MASCEVLCSLIAEFYSKPIEKLARSTNAIIHKCYNATRSLNFILKYRIEP